MKRQDLTERASEGETLILDRINGKIHHLNSTASYVWARCERSSAKTIAAELTQAYQIDPGSAEKDVMVLLGEMRTMNLLEPCDDGS